MSNVVVKGLLFDLERLCIRSEDMALSANEVEDDLQRFREEFEDLLIEANVMAHYLMRMRRWDSGSDPALTADDNQELDELIRKFAPPEGDDRDPDADWDDFDDDEDDEHEEHEEHDDEEDDDEEDDDEEDDDEEDDDNKG